MGFFSKLCGKKDTASEKCAESLKVSDTSVEESVTKQVEPNTEKESATDTAANGVCTVCDKAPKDDKGDLYDSCNDQMPDSET